ncbi:hypothetical protein Tco_0208065, partial [Tanacetum coccineum]
LPEDDVLPAEEQPLLVAASPTTESPGYIPESDPEEDPEEDDEEDPADYLADRGDDDDDDDDAEEEEHLVSADPAAVAYSADQDPYLAYREIAPTTLEGVNQRVTELTTTVDQEDEIIYSQLDDARHDRALLRARVNMLYKDRPFHRRTALLIEEEARVSRVTWAQSMDACDQVRSEGISLWTTVMAQQSKITELQAADHRRQSVISDLLK